MKYYAGIGGRDTPRNICQDMTNIAIILDNMGFILRSGGAVGADSAFECGTKRKEIYLPFDGFNGRWADGEDYLLINDVRAKNIAKTFHPFWNTMGAKSRQFHTRNVHQIFGKDLDQGREYYSKFVICWTKDGKASGGTGQAMRIADHYDIPIYNLYNIDYKSVIEDIKKNYV